MCCMSSAGEYLLLKRRGIKEEFSSDLCVELILHIPAKNTSISASLVARLMCVLYNNRERETDFSKQFLLGMEPKCSGNSASILQKRLKFYNGCICVCLSVMHTLHYYKCTCVISTLLGLCFHASMTLIESNHGGRASL